MFDEILELRSKKIKSRRMVSLLICVVKSVLGDVAAINKK